MLQDTMSLSGSEAYVAVLAYYNYLKGEAKTGVLKAQTYSTISVSVSRDTQQKKAFRLLNPEVALLQPFLPKIREHCLILGNAA